MSSAAPLALGSAWTCQLPEASVHLTGSPLLEPTITWSSLIARAKLEPPSDGRLKTAIEAERA